MITIEDRIISQNALIKFKDGELIKSAPMNLNNDILVEGINLVEESTSDKITIISQDVEGLDAKVDAHDIKLDQIIINDNTQDNNIDIITSNDRSQDNTIAYHEARLVKIEQGVSTTPLVKFTTIEVDTSSGNVTEVPLPAEYNSGLDYLQIKYRGLHLTEDTPTQEFDYLIDELARKIIFHRPIEIFQNCFILLFDEVIVTPGVTFLQYFEKRVLTDGIQDNWLYPVTTQPILSYVQVHLNGLCLREGVNNDYILVRGSNDTSIKFNTVPPAGLVLNIVLCKNTGS